MAAKWGAGGWADQVEETEAQNGGPLTNDEAFPTLGQAAEIAKKEVVKGKKGKGQKMNLADFVSMPIGGGVKSDRDILVSLPTSSRGKVEGEETGGRLGGAFKDYGGERRGGYRGDDDGERPPRREEMGPSRADEVDDWGKTRTFTPSDSGARGGFGGGGSFRDRGDRDERPPREMGPSRADEVDSWGTKKAYEPSSGGFGGDRGGDRRGGFGGGFGEYREREGGFRDRDGGFQDRGARFEPSSRADGEDTWSRKTAYTAEAPSSRHEDATSRADQADAWSRRTSGPRDAPSDGAAERPRLKLAPRTLPVPERPAATSNSDTSAPASEAGGDEPREEKPKEAPKPRANPFGAARPREEVLKEKGIDPIKDSLKREHEPLIRERTDEEVALQREIEGLHLKVEALSANDSTDPEELDDLRKQADEKERALIKLTLELDDQVRFAKAAPPAQHHDDRRGGRRDGPPRDTWERRGAEPRSNLTDRPARDSRDHSRDGEPPSREPAGERAAAWDTAEPHERPEPAAEAQANGAPAASQQAEASVPEADPEADVEADEQDDEPQEKAQGEQVSSVAEPAAADNGSPTAAGGEDDDGWEQAGPRKASRGRGKA